MPENKDISTRNLPISLQGIETILLYLYQKENIPLSMRNISDQTGMSMRVVKNVLLQLEKFNQVERILEKNNVLPKWKITKFGRRVVKEANFEESIRYLSREEELLSGYEVQDNPEDIRKKIEETQEIIVSDLNVVQVDLSKILGFVLNLNDPQFENVISFAIKRIKFLSQKISNLQTDPSITFSLKKVGEKQKKLNKSQLKRLLAEISFFDSLILNETRRIADNVQEFAQHIENQEISNALLIASDLRDEIRILSTLFYQRNLLDENKHVLNEDAIESLINNKFGPEILEGILKTPLSQQNLLKTLEDCVIKFIARINKGDTKFADHNIELTESIPIYMLFQLILDEEPQLQFSMQQLEEVLNSLANNGYIPGVKIIQGEDDDFLKVVQLKAHDISRDESKLISVALKLQNFTLADVIKETGWLSEKTVDLLNNLTNLGILNYSKSFLHGEQWYIISENLERKKNQ